MRRNRLFKKRKVQAVNRVVPFGVKGSTIVWHEHETNPLIHPPFPSWIIGDPTFLPPGETHDGLWHLFAYSLLGIHQFVSTDGIAWDRKETIIVRRGIRPFLYREDGIYYLFFEHVHTLLPFKLASNLQVTTSRNLRDWTKPKTVLTPSLDWHHVGYPTIGNPCVIRFGTKYRLYYSAGSIWLKESFIFEPYAIGYAESETILGPYTFANQPLFTPSRERAYYNLAAGSLKVIRYGNRYLGLHNGIYHDSFLRSRSALHLLESSDGINWDNVHQMPLVGPTHGWKRAYVYACDIREINTMLHVYFNARDGWGWGVERIGKLTGIVQKDKR